MRVLLLSTNRCRNIVPPFPLGVAAVAASVDHRRHDVRIWDAMFQQDWPASLRETIAAFRPEVVGVSVRNVDDQNMRDPCFFLDEVGEMVAVAREAAPDATLVGGGAGFSMFPESIVSRVGLHGGVIGEGETVFPNVLARLEAGQSPAGLAGGVWREGKDLVTTPPDWSAPVAELAWADRRMVDTARYYDARGTADIPNPITVQSKRGCPLQCIYCSTFAVEGAGIRTRRPAEVVDELSALSDQGYERIQFVDSVFTNPPSHARAICEEILRRGLSVRWSATASPASAEPGLLRLMHEAGCSLVMLGHESGCDRMLQSMRKGFDRDALVRTFEACEEIGLPYNAFLLLGAPGETRDTVRESVELLQRHRPAHVSVSIGLRIYPGCELARIAEAEGVVEPGSDLLTPRFYLARAVDDWIWAYLEPIVASTANWGF